MRGAFFSAIALPQTDSIATTTGIRSVEFIDVHTIYIHIQHGELPENLKIQTHINLRGFKPPVYVSIVLR